MASLPSFNKVCEGKSKKALKGCAGGDSTIIVITTKMNAVRNQKYINRSPLSYITYAQLTLKGKNTIINEQKIKEKSHVG